MSSPPRPNVPWTAPQKPSRAERPLAPWRQHLHEIIFEAETHHGKLFDVVLLVLIIVSIGATALESVKTIAAQWGFVLRVVEWFVTVLFTIEYICRLIAVRKPLSYARSFFGIVDLLAILPTYLSLFIIGSQSLIVIRGLRLLRVFRVLKLAEFVGEAQQLVQAMRASSRKIIVFLAAVSTLVMIVGAVMYLVEGEANGFTSIPQSVYWAIVTMTTVGYGDISPQTVAGKTIASMVMILGYGIIAVPTGIVTAELAGAYRGKVNTRACPACGSTGHAPDAKFCKDCSSEL